MGFKGSRFKVQDSGFRVQGSRGSKGSKGVVRRIIIWKRREVLEYMIFAKDEKPVNLLNLLNLQNPLNL